METKQFSHSLAHGLAHWTFTQRMIEAPVPPQNQRLWRNNVLQSEVETVGRMIVAGRKEVGLTQRQLAQKADIRRKTLGRWERGRAVPNAADWLKLRRFLNFSGIRSESQQEPVTAG